MEIRTKIALGLMFLLSNPCFAENIARVTFVSPNPPAKGFWQTYEKVMQHAATQLDIELTIVHAAAIDRFSFNEALTEAISAQPTPDYLVTLFRHNTTRKLFSLLAGTNIKLFASNADIPNNAKSKFQGPRIVQDNWIGHMYPDDFAAGVILARALARQVKQKQSLENINIAAISGSRDSPVSFSRAQGLKDFAVKSGLLKITRLMYSDWHYATAVNLTQHILTRFPEVKTFWCASDEIARAAITQIKNQGNIHDYNIASIDWSENGIEAFKKGELITTLGGHFMEGGMILALLHDYHQGIDFKDVLGLTMTMEMDELSQRNIDMVEHIVMRDGEASLDFTKLSAAKSGEQRFWSSNYVNTINAIYEQKQ